MSVICQLRFNPILRIDAETPADFQERIRQEFPLFREKTMTSDLASNLPESLQNLIRASAVQKQKRQAYDFISEDETWTLGLTREFLALSTSKYPRWEEFRAKLRNPIEALVDIYDPAFFTRVGLRYRNVIQRSKLGLEEASWADLLKPQTSGIFSAQDMHGAVEECQTQTLIRFSDGSGTVRMSHGIAQDPDNENEECYLIDNDFFTDLAISATQADSDWGRLEVNVATLTTNTGVSSGYLNVYTDAGWVRLQESFHQICQVTSSQRFLKQRKQC